MDGHKLYPYTLFFSLEKFGRHVRSKFDRRIIARNGCNNFLSNHQIYIFLSYSKRHSVHPSKNPILFYHLPIK